MMLIRLDKDLIHLRYHGAECWMSECWALWWWRWCVRRDDDDTLLSPIDFVHYKNNRKYVCHTHTPESVKGKIRITFAIALNSSLFLTFSKWSFLRFLWSQSQLVFAEQQSFVRLTVSTKPYWNKFKFGFSKSYPAKHAHLFPNERQRGGNGGKWHENAWNDKRNNQIVPGSRFYTRLPLWLVLWSVYTVWQEPEAKRSARSDLSRFWPLLRVQQNGRL